jgi:hypothetical protein
VLAVVDDLVRAPQGGPQVDVFRVPEPCDDGDVGRRIAARRRGDMGRASDSDSHASPVALTQSRRVSRFTIKGLSPSVNLSAASLHARSQLRSVVHAGRD